MLIRSQDKKSLVNLDNIESIDISGYRVGKTPREVFQDDENANTWYVAYSGYEKMLFIGRYSTEAKAIKVLDAIANAYSLANSTFDNGDVYWQSLRESNLVFQMPADSEVEV